MASALTTRVLFSLLSNRDIIISFFKKGTYLIFVLYCSYYGSDPAHKLAPDNQIQFPEKTASPLKSKLITTESP